MTMYSKVDSEKDGKQIEKFFNSDIVKFIFLITQYASGKMTKNEPLVANSITIPPDGVDDYYNFFGIEKHKKYIEDILSDYYDGKTKKKIINPEQPLIVVESSDKHKVEPKKSPIKLDKKLLLIPATEAKEEISISRPIPKKKRTIKKRPKLLIVESFSEDKVVTENSNAEKIEPQKQQPKTKAKKKSKQIILRGGAIKKKTKKKKYCLSLSSFTRRLKTKLNNNIKPKKTRRK